MLELKYTPDTSTPFIRTWVTVTVTVGPVAVDVPLVVKVVTVVLLGDRIVVSVVPLILVSVGKVAVVAIAFGTVVVVLEALVV